MDRYRCVNGIWYISLYGVVYGVVYKHAGGEQWIRDIECVRGFIRSRIFHLVRYYGIKS